MNEQRLRDELRQTPIDDGARTRALGVVRAAFLEGEPAPRRRWTPVVALAVCLIAVVVAVGAASEPGDAVARWMRDVLGTGRDDARPALVRVPGGGRLLVTSERGGGAWVVSADGTRRRLGDYSGASWSPRGLFVVAWRDGELLAVEPGGRVRWSLARDGRIAAARWAPGDGFRIAYVAGRSLRVVNGDGTGDRRYAAAAAVAPAWHPDGRRYVLAYVDRRDHVRVVAVDSGREIWRSRQVGGASELAWSPDGRRLLVAVAGGWRVLGADGLVLARGSSRGFTVDDVAWAPGGERIVVVRGVGDSGDVMSVDPAGRARERVLFSGPGRFGRVAFSPDGQRLLVPWPDADQWLFLVRRGGHVSAVANIGRQFARGRRNGPFPDAVEWCCAGS